MSSSYHPPFAAQRGTHPAINVIIAIKVIIIIQLFNVFLMPPPLQLKGYISSYQRYYSYQCYHHHPAIQCFPHTSPLQLKGAHIQLSMSLSLSSYSMFSSYHPLCSSKGYTSSYPVPTSNSRAAMLHFKKSGWVH